MNSSLNTNTLSVDTAMMASQRTTKPVAHGNVEQLRKVAKDFEGVFLSQMLKPMFANLGAEKPFGGGTGEDMWRSLQVDEFGKAISNNGGIGIADNIFREMLKLQEAK